mgnify:CR=1 FL=1
MEKHKAYLLKKGDHEMQDEHINESLRQNERCEVVCNANGSICDIEIPMVGNREAV